MDLTLVDPELLPALEAMPELDIWADLGVIRKMAFERSAFLASQQAQITSVSSADYQVVQVDDDNVPVRVYRPANVEEQLPALLWIHGGGFCFGSLEADDYSVKSMVEAIGCVVVSVDYRLAPEFPFPTPLNDCYAALCWTFEQADQLAIDRERIGIAGISAGGGLAAGLALLARDKGEVNVVFQGLLCPMIDHNSDRPSSHMITDKRIWNRHSNLQGWMHYLGRDFTSEEQTIAASKYAAPSHASNLHGLPPAYIGVGSVDLFVDENKDYAERRQACGVDAQLAIFPGGYHAFEFYVPDAQISRTARATHYEAIKKGLFLSEGV